MRPLRKRLPADGSAASAAGVAPGKPPEARTLAHLRVRAYCHVAVRTGGTP